MKYKALVSSTNNAFLKDFFLAETGEYSCISASTYWADVKSHFQLLNPDVYICMIDDKDSSINTVIKQLADSYYLSNVPVVVVADEEVYSSYAAGNLANVRLILKRPITVPEILSKVTEMLTAKEKARKLEEAQKAMEEANRKRSILIVDDDKNILKLLKAIIEEKERYTATTMITGKMAEKYLETRTCDLILLDYEMPVENGPAVYKKIKEIESAKDIPIVFLTGVADKEKIAEVLQLKPQGYLLKPIDVDKLFETLERLTYGK